MKLPLGNGCQAAHQGTLPLLCCGEMHTSHTGHPFHQPKVYPVVALSTRTGCATITTIWFQNILISPKRKPVPIHSPSPPASSH